jgi:hypothetical protein
VAALIPQQGKSDEELAAFVALVRKVEAGDEGLLPQLREALRDPRWVELLGGDLARWPIDRLLTAASGGRLVVREAIVRKMDLLRAELAGPDPSADERLLADRVVACWLHLHHLEYTDTSLTAAGGQAGELLQRAVDRAHRRYLSAIKTLATVRKLALPALQLNIARKQVNVVNS